MTKTYQSIRKQIDILERQAQALKRKEVQGVVGRIKTAIKAYALTASDLGFGARGEKAAAPAAPKKRTAKTAAATGKVAVKFRDEAGNTWTGRGSRPRWLTAALAAGRKLEEFAV